MKYLLTSLGILLLSFAAGAQNTVVAPGDLHGWNVQTSGAATVRFEVGPGTPPLGIGSAELSVGADGDQAAQLRNPNYAGTLLTALTNLSYSTYVDHDGSGGQAPYILLNVDYDGNGSIDDQLFFEPVYQDATFCPSNPQPHLVLQQWQSWDALHGCWWSVNGTAGAGPGTDTKPLTAIIAVKPAAAIAATGSGLGAVRIVTGFGAGAWDNFVGNADKFRINGDTFDFEPYAVASNTNQCKNGGWTTFKRANGSSFKNQGDCIQYVNTGK